jgi:hypothetical protein
MHQLTFDTWPLLDITCTDDTDSVQVWLVMAACQAHDALQIQSIEQQIQSLLAHVRHLHQADAHPLDEGGLWDVDSHISQQNGWQEWALTLALTATPVDLAKKVDRMSL